jgi:hypothetical protein
MFQREVVDRLVALPRSKDYGRLSVLVQHVCTVQRLFDVAPSAFVPPPKVTSSVVQLRPRPADRRLADLGPLERVTAAAFGQRRKMLRGVLGSVFADPTAVLTRLSLPPTARAEELTVADFVRLSEAISAGNVCKYSLVIARPLLARGEGNAEMDLRIVSKSWREKVVLTAPEGEDSTSIRPRRWMAGAWASFNILNLLPHALGGALQIDADPRELDIGRLRA